MKKKPGPAKSRGATSVRAQAKQILAILRRHAERSDVRLTYADLARQTGIANCALRAPMEHLSKTLRVYATASEKQIPPLQVLVVNSKTGVPGAGAWLHIGEPYVRSTGSQALTSEQQRSVIARIHEDIGRFQEWEAVERELMQLL